MIGQANPQLRGGQNWTFPPPPSFKYYVIRLGGGLGVKAFDDLDDTGGVGVQNLGKPDDVILERYLIAVSPVLAQFNP